MRRFSQFIFLLLIAVVFGLFLIWPITRVISVAFMGMPEDPNRGFTFGYIVAIFRDEALREGLFNSAKIAIGTTALCIVISMPLALLSVRFSFAGKSLVRSVAPQ